MNVRFWLMLLVGVSREVKLDHTCQSFISLFCQFREINHDELVVWQLAQQIQPNNFTHLVVAIGGTKDRVPSTKLVA
jgi:hypothetical protein